MLCIFCRADKTRNQFTLEHVFPATIGGAFILLNVCKECNTTLGKNIDNPLSRHDMVLWYRNVLQIARVDGKTKRSNIPNPFKGKPKMKDTEGNEYYSQFEDGKPISHIIPQYAAPEFASDGFFGKVTIPAKDYISDDKIVENYAKKFGIPFEAITHTMIEKTVIAPQFLNYQFAAANNIFILGALKIAYEYTATFLPEYLNDPLSKRFAQILLTKSIEGCNDLFDADPSIRKTMEERIETIEGLQLHHHVISLITVPGKGLLCGVRIFNWVYGIRMSASEDFLKTEALTLINDAKSRMWSANIQAHLKSYSISIETNGFNKLERREFEIAKANKLADCKTPTGKFPIYDLHGKLLHKHIDGILKELRVDGQKYDHHKKEVVIPVTFYKNRYFAKSKKRRVLFPLLSATYVYKLVY